MAELSLFPRQRLSLVRRRLPLIGLDNIFRIVRRGGDLVALDPGRASLLLDDLAMRRTGVALPCDLGAGFESLGHQKFLRLTLSVNRGNDRA